MDKLSEGLVLTTIDTNFSRIVKDLLNVSVLGLGAYRKDSDGNLTFLVYNNYDLTPINFSLSDPQFPNIEFYELEGFYSYVNRKQKYESYSTEQILLNLARVKAIVTGQSLVAHAAFEIIKKPVKFVPFPDSDKFIFTHSIKHDCEHHPTDDVTDFMQEYLRSRHLIVRNEKIDFSVLENRLKELSVLLYNMFSNGVCDFEATIVACIGIQEALQFHGSEARLLIPNLSLPCISVIMRRKLTSIDVINCPIATLKLEAEKVTDCTEKLDLYQLLIAINNVLEYNNVAPLLIKPNIYRATVSTFPHFPVYKFVDNVEMLSIEEMKRLLIELNRLTKSSVKWGSPIDPRIGEAMNCLVDALSRYADID